MRLIALLVLLGTLPSITGGADAGAPAVRGNTSGWTLCIDFDGSTTFVAPWGRTVATAPSGLDGYERAEVIATVTAAFRRWQVAVLEGECNGPRRATIFMVSAAPPEAPAGSGGIAWVTGWGNAAWSYGFVFVPLVGEFFDVTAVHEAGHLAGLGHPDPPDPMSVMTDNLSRVVGWTPAEVVQLDAWFSG